MRDVHYWEKENRLVYLDEKATPEFWDSRWQTAGKPPVISPSDDVVKVTKNYLASGSRILEGGCGRANKVKAMADAGFNAIGLDFAEQSVNQARIDYPGLDIQQGDVRSLDFSDNYFDGYWSIGVIEHFWNGYDSILSEAARVIKPEGIMFLSAPWFSPYRKYKARSGGYANAEFADEPNSFYQFALSKEEVCKQLEKHGFELLSWQGRAAEISMREDMIKFKPQIDWLFGSRGGIVKRVLRRAITNSLELYCGHSFLAVARRKF